MCKRATNQSPDLKLYLVVTAPPGFKIPGSATNDNHNSYVNKS